MRKLLLASAAILGVAPGVAMAQTQPSQGTMVGPYATGPMANDLWNATGSPSTFYGAASYGKDAAPTPGTVVIRFNGRVETEMVGAWSTNDHTGIGATSFKTNPIGLNSYVRLYPGIDGMATNGLRYGASVELRENFPGGTAQPTPALTTAPSGSTYTSGQTIYARRTFVYLGSDKLGILRIGAADGVIGIFDPCLFSAACWDGGMGELNGAGPQGSGTNGAFAVPFVLAQAGAEYGNTKMVYLTPQFGGFDFGIQYAPSMGNGYSSCSIAGPGCNNTTTGTDATRWYNQVAVGGRFQHKFGNVDVGVYAVYETAAKEAFNGAPVSSGFGVTGNRYDNLSFVNAASYVTFHTSAGDITVSADYIGGATNGQVTMKPSGGVDENQILAGVMYSNGPLKLGVQWNTIDSQGTVSMTHVTQRHEVALAVGGSYALAPGLGLWVEYQYAHRHQGGVNMVGNGVPGTVDASGQALIVGTAVSW